MATLTIGDLVIYHSDSRGAVPAKVVGGPNPDGSYDLDCKPRVLPNRIVKHVPNSTSCAPDAAPRPAPLPPHMGGFTGERCFYRSGTHGWIPARVVRQNEDGTCDLDCKPRVPPAGICRIHEGLLVDYNSASQGWIPAQVLRLLGDLIDLDCKPGVELTRVRPRVCPEAPTSAAADRPLSGAVFMPPHSEPARNMTMGVGAMVPPLLEPAQSLYSVAGGYAQASALGAPVMLAPPSPVAQSTPQFHFVKGQSLQPAQPAMMHDRSAQSMPQRGSVGELALEAVRGAMQRGDLSSLQVALRNAEVHGVPRSELLLGERALQVLELRQAASGSDVARLRAALRAATQNAVPQPEVDAATRALQVLEARGASVDAGREAIKRAEASGDPLMIKAAIDAHAGQLSHAELEAARGSLHAAEARAAWTEAGKAELQRAVQSRDTRALRAALDHAAKAGLPEPMLRDASAALRSLETEQAVSEAAARGDVPGLEAAKAAALQAGFPQQRLAALLEEARGPALNNLRQAMQMQNPPQLRRAVEMAAAVGISGDELDKANHNLWALEAMPRALAELHQAMQGQRQDELSLAIDAAAATGVSAQELEAAAACLRRAGASPSAAQANAAGKQNAKAAVTRAMETRNAVALQEAIQKATNAGIPDTDLVDAVAALRHLKAQGPALEELLKAEDSGNAASLRAAITYAEAAGVNASDLQAARARLQGIESVEAHAPLTQPRMAPLDGWRQEATTRPAAPGLKTRIFGPAPADACEDAGILTRVFGPAQRKDAGFLERIFPGASAALSGLTDSAVYSATSASNSGMQHSGLQHAMHTRTSWGVAGGTQPQLHAPSTQPGGTQPQLHVPLTQPGAITSAMYTGYGGAGDTQPQLYVAPLTQPGGLASAVYGGYGAAGGTQPQLQVPPSTDPQLQGY